MTSAQNPSPPASLDFVPALRTLEQAECEEVLRRNVVGRLAFALHDRVNIVPIHFVYEAGWIHGRTEPGGKLVEILRNRRVAFEVDEHDGLFSWRSVVVHGSLYLVDSAGDDEAKRVYDHSVRLLRRLLPATMRAGDPVPFRTELFRVQVSEISGRASSLGGTRIQPFKPNAKDRGSDPALDVALSKSVRAAIASLVPEASRVNVDVFDNVVVLSGVVDTPADRNAIEKAVIDLDNVDAVVLQLETVFPTHIQNAPAELARVALRELHGNSTLKDVEVKVVVDHEWLRAEGTAGDRDAKEEALRRLRGVAGIRGVIDRIHLPKGLV